MPTTSRLLRLAQDGIPNDIPAPNDTELLQRYISDRDEAAFAELVRRNGPLVLRTCRHILGEVTAEDAFQVTFLLMARSARRLTRSGSLAGWLHATAVQIANNTRRGEDRRRKREAVHQSSPTAPDDMTWREVREVLDAEIAALPECYRLPLVLCYLQELSYEDAAQQVGCSVGALRGRLERGKVRLRKRLTRYGLPMAAPALVVGHPPSVSASLVETTLGIVRSGTEGNIPRALTGLLPVKGRLRVTLFLAPAVIAIAAIGAILAACAAPATDAPEVDPPKSANPIASVPATQTHADFLGDPLPVGAVARLGTRRFFGVNEPRWMAFSHDGSKIATEGWYGVTVCDAVTGRQLFERGKYAVAGNAIGWRADGKGIAIVKQPDQTFFVSEFTDLDEKLPNPAFVRRGAGRDSPDGLEFLSLSPDATQLAIVRTPDEKQFTIDILPATPGRSVNELKPVKTLGPFLGQCREIRFTTRGVLYLSGSWKQDDWTITFVDLDKKAVSQTVRIPLPAYCVWGFMYSLSADARLAAIPRQPQTVPAGRSDTNEYDGTIRLCNLETGKELGTIPFSKVGYGTGHAFTPDGKKLITSGENPYFQIWDVETLKEIARSPRQNGRFGNREASAVAVSPDGKRFATARRDGRIDVWDTTTAKASITYDTHRAEVSAVAVSPDGRLTATLGHDESLCVWEVANGKPVCTILAQRNQSSPQAGPKRKPVFTPDGHGLLFPSREVLAMVNPLTGKPLDLPTALREFKGVVGGFSTDGKTLTTLSGDTVTLWDWPVGIARVSITVPLASEKSAIPNKGPESVRVNWVQLSPDGRLLFTNSVREPIPGDGGHQNSNDMWDARTGKHLHELETPETWYPPVSFSPDSRVIYLGGHSVDTVRPGGERKRADALTAWDPVVGTFLRRFVEPDRTGQPRSMPDFGRHVQALALSPDGRLLAVAESSVTFDGVWLYEAVSGRPLKKLVGHEREVTDLIFSPDGRRLISVSDDQTGLVWDVTLPALVARPSVKPTVKELADAWERLVGTDPALGYLGIATLCASPTETVPLLKEKLRPAATPTDADLDRITTQLAAGEFAVREKASAELELFGPNAVTGAKARLARASSPEVHERLTRFLSRYDGPNVSPYDLRCIRGIAALETIGTSDARTLLSELAKGRPDDVLTRQASAAIRRTGNR